MQVKRIAGALGAIVEGVDLSQDILQSAGTEIRALLNEHEVLFFRDQEMTPEHQRNFGHIFGPLQTHSAYQCVNNLPEVMLLESTRDKPSKIEAWHTDMTFREHPPSVTILRSVVTPAVGGDTLWASMTAAYNALSRPMQRYLDEFVAVHDFRAGFRESLAEDGGEVRLASMVRDNPPVRHRVIQTHPETGKKVLYVNALFTTHIVGLPPLESREILNFLFKHVSSPEFTCRFQWSPDDIAVWDNRSTQHKPVNDFFPATRRMHRVVSEGFMPY